MAFYIPAKIGIKPSIDLFDYFTHEKDIVQLLPINPALDHSTDSQDNRELSRYLSAPNIEQERHPKHREGAPDIRERFREAQCNVPLWEEDWLGFDEFDEFSMRIKQKIITDPLFLMRNFESLNTHYPHFLNNALVENIGEFNLFEIHSRNFYLNSFLDCLFSKPLKRDKSNYSSSLEFVLDEITELAIHAQNDDPFNLYLDKLKLWHDQNPLLLEFLDQELHNLTFRTDLAKKRLLLLTNLITEINSVHMPAKKKRNASPVNCIETSPFRFFPFQQEGNSSLTVNLRIANAFGFHEN